MDGMDNMMNPKQMPHSIEAEQSVIGAILIDPELINSTGETLIPEAFYRANHQHIFRAMLMLNEQNKEIDSVTLMDPVSSRIIIRRSGRSSLFSRISK